MTDLAALDALIEAGDELIFPETLAETRAMISEMIGESTELKTWLSLQYQGRRGGLRVDWDKVKEAQDDIARLQGDIAALKKHASGFREDDQKTIAQTRAEKAQIKAENQKRQGEMQREAMTLKNDKRVKAAERERQKSEAAHKAVMAYLASNAPDHFQSAQAVANAARMVVEGL